MTDSLLQDSAATTPGQQAQPTPPVPVTTEDTGLTPGLISDLILKALYNLGARTGEQLRSFVRLPFAILDEQLVDLQQRRLVERNVGPEQEAERIARLAKARQDGCRRLHVGPANEVEHLGENR